MRERSILLAEPNEPIRTLVEMVLRQGGYDVTSVADGRSAVDALEREWFACVVVGSPVTVESEGETRLFLEYVEQHCPEWRPTLVVITSYVDNRRVLSVAARLNACAVIAKPFSPQQLLDVVDGCITSAPLPTRWVGIPDSLIPASAAERKQEP